MSMEDGNSGAARAADDEMSDGAAHDPDLALGQLFGYGFFN